jgi:biopolymer transport protein ExbD
MRVARSQIQSDINVTPLVDVCLVLLIIFMIVLPEVVNGVPVKLPKTATGAEVSGGRKTTEITVKEDGSVYIDALIVRHEEVPEAMKRQHELHPERSIAVRGDKSVPYGSIVSVLDASRAAGYENVGLIGEKQR